MSSNLLKLSFTSFFTDISSEMIYPFLGIYFATIGATPVLIGIIEGIAEGLAYILRIFSGFISDYLQKRKNLTIVGYSLSALGKVFLYVFELIFLVSFGRWLDKIGKGIRNAPRDALISESVPSEQKGRAFGFHRFMDTLGAALGVLLSFFVLVFYFNDGSTSKEIIKFLILLSIIPAFIGVIFLFFVQETPTTTKKESVNEFFLQGYWEIKQNKNLQAFFVLNFLFALSNSSDQFIFLKASDEKLKLQDIVLSYFFYNITYVIFSYPAGKLSDKIPRKILIGIGYIIYALTYFLIPNIDNLASLLMIFSLYGIYKGVSEGVEKAFLTDYSLKYKASILGLQSTLYGIAMILASSIGGWIWYNFGSTTMFYFDAALAFIAGISLLIFIE